MSRLVALALLTFAAAACSGTSERDAAVLDDPQAPDAGSIHRPPDADADADELDASDEKVLVPNDADRSEHGGQCIKDETCAVLMNPGLCERALCEKGYCVKENRPDGTSCDDGNACTSGDSCKGGQCSHNYYNPAAPGCLHDPEPGSLQFTEIMGNPALDVDPIVGQWFEVEASAAYRLKGLKLVYYEWEEGAMPMNPSSPVVEVIASEHGESGPMIFLRSQDIEKNRWGNAPWGYSKIQFSRTKNARLMLVASSWDESFPVPGNLVLADIELAAGTFSDDYKGRSWQRSSDPANAAAFCHTPSEATYEYWNGNFATPFQANVECP